jgi:ATP-binding cassette subfamily C (CFTR/MRP) protein 1
MALANFLGSVGSFQRIQEFLETDVRVDSRKVSKQSLDRPTFISPINSQKRSAHSSATVSVVDGETPPDYPSATSNAVVVQDAAFGWDKGKEPILSSVNITIPQHRFTMLIGPVGCGKSTLIKALLGEAFTLNGSVQVSSSEIAFCDQTAWHMNASVRQSIIGVSQMDEMWYKSVIRACALEEDLKQLPKGDRTTIGSSGIALSGGQSQRIVSTEYLFNQKLC